MTDPVYSPIPLPIDAPQRRRLPPLLRRAWYGLNQAFRRRIAHLELTPDQFTVLRTLIENRGVTQRELTNLMSSDPNTVASLVERMERNGVLARVPHEKDKRAHRLQVKPAGIRKYQRARDAAIALQTEVLGALPPEKREEFLEQLTLVAEVCRATAEGEGQRTKGKGQGAKSEGQRAGSGGAEVRSQRSEVED